MHSGEKRIVDQGRLNVERLGAHKRENDMSDSFFQYPISGYNIMLPMPVRIVLYFRLLVNSPCQIHDAPW